MSKVIRVCFTTLCDWSKKPRANGHLLDQSNARTKLTTSWTRAFSRAWSQSRVFALCSHLFIVLFMFVAIGHCNCFGLVLRHSLKIAVSHKTTSTRVQDKTEKRKSKEKKLNKTNLQFLSLLLVS